MGLPLKIKKGVNKMNEKKKQTYSKKLMTVYSLFIIIWITWSYVLATLGYKEIAQDLSSNVVIVGVAAILGYFGKSFFETKEEEKMKLEWQKIESIVASSTSIQEEEENEELKSEDGIEGTDKEENDDSEEETETYIMEE